jgi:hypothetical protein
VYRGCSAPGAAAGGWGRGDAVPSACTIWI